MSCNLGKDGVVKIKEGSGTLTAVGHVRGWTIDEKVDQLEATAMGDNYKVYCTALKDWSGSLDILWEPTDAGQAMVQVGDSLDITVYPEGTTGTSSIAGSIVVTGINTKATYNGLVEASITFQGTGSLVRA
jgi:predicted secreted protein